MTREQYIDKAVRLRKGKDTAIVHEDKHGRRYSVLMTHGSLNEAKKANGPMAVALQRGEHFPPTKDQLPLLDA